MARDLCTGLPFLFCIALLVSMEAHSAGARVALQVAAPAVVSAMARPENNLDPFYTSKRKVPNGPDPIHNRRAGKSGRPPVRA
ncbi:CLAVATA3/ESR (CLE)-related protein 25-like [Zingiber officinale]|uniref:CLAVATA3/ESR (CLE)-related protein 25-like n=1 Tax=Zingiber officinale TaxID=94328 RepID=UPI001C4CFB41|nr:CLAVATA3/ESR (CLE)-related protein 25-like [Zingiber officinale]